MSNEAQGLVRNLPIEAPHKPILMAYANYADEGGYCWPGVDTIAFDTGYSTPTVVRVRRELVKKNWVRSKRQFGTSAITRLNLPKIASEGIDRGDRTKVRPEFEFEDDETAGQNRTDHTDLNDETAGQNQRNHSDLNDRVRTDPRTDHTDLSSQITLISTRDHTDHLSISDSSVDPSVGEPSERENEGSSKKQAEPATWALGLIAGLDFGRFRRPTQSRARSMARKVEHARNESGLTEMEIKRHCRAALNEATSNGAAYLDGALDPDRLPIPSSSKRSFSPSAHDPHASWVAPRSETRQQALRAIPQSAQVKAKQRAGRERTEPTEHAYEEVNREQQLSALKSMYSLPQ